MGSQSKYNKKELVYVNITAEAETEGGGTPEQFKYGFFTNIPLTNQTVLGQVKIPEASYSNPPTKLVIGCSFPKPRRASKREAQRFTSSFVSKDKILDAKKAGYRVTASKARSKLILPGSAAFVETAYVAINGIKYGWNIPKVTETNAGELGGLGVMKPTASDRDEICFGASYPKPGRASKTFVSGDDIKIVSTYYDPSKTELPTGWSPVGKPKLSL